MRRILAKYSGCCTRCHDVFPPGTPVYYQKGLGARHARAEDCLAERGELVDPPVVDEPATPEPQPPRAREDVEGCGCGKAKP